MKNIGEFNFAINFYHTKCLKKSNYNLKLLILLLVFIEVFINTYKYAINRQMFVLINYEKKHNIYLHKTIICRENEYFFK